MNSSTLTTYADTTYLLHSHKVATIMGWDVAKSMLEQCSFFLVVLWVPPNKHCIFYEIMLMIDSAEEVNTRLRSKSRNHPTIPEAIIQLIKNEFNKSFRQVFTSALPVRWMDLMLLTRMITMGFLRLESVSMKGILQDAVITQSRQKRAGELTLEDGGNTDRLSN